MWLNECAYSHSVPIGTHTHSCESQTGLMKQRWRKLGKNEVFQAFKRPALAVWGNGLWGSVGRAGRSFTIRRPTSIVAI